MRILVISLHFWPDMVSNSFMTTGIVEELAVRGHEVTVVTSLPFHREHRIEEGYRGRLWQREEYKPGITLLRCYLLIRGAKTNIAGRFVAYLSHTVTTTLGALTARRPRAVMAISPPLTIGLTAYLVSRVRRAPFVYSVRDVYPDVAIRLGVLRNPLLIGLSRRLERFVYRRAAAVTVLTEDVRANLLTKGVPDEKIVVIPHFADTVTIRPLPRENEFAIQHGLSGKFVVMYAGNVGFAQGLDIVLDAAALTTDPTIRYAIVGTGAERGRLEEGAHERGLANVAFLPYQTGEAVRWMHASADVALVSLRAGIAADALPAKVFTAMASGRPVVAAVDPDSQVAGVVREADAGIVVPPGDAPGLVSAVGRLRADPILRSSCADRGRRFVEENYSRARIGARYAALFERLAGPERVGAGRGR